MKKQSKKILVLFGFIFVLACKGLPTPPDGTIDDEKMSRLLADIHLTEAKVARMNLKGYDSSQVAFRTLKLDLFKKYQVDSITYRKSYEFYAANPQYLIKIYENSIKILEQEQKKKK